MDNTVVDGNFPELESCAGILHMDNTLFVHSLKNTGVRANWNRIKMAIWP
jgi:hypothetical protein